MKTIGRVGILGDSYSTFGGYVPEGYHVYYDYDSGEEYGYVNDVNLTWWKQVMNTCNGQLIINSSYSGSCVANYDYNANDDCTPSSFVTRAQKDLGSDVELDTILIYGCTNDYWRHCVRGNMQYDGFTVDNLNTLFPAICFTLDFLRKAHPSSRIVFITNPFFSEDIVNAVHTACDHYGAQHLHLKEFERVEGHPNLHGMQQIAEQITAFLLGSDK